MSCPLDLSYCEPVNHLWSDFLQEFGIEKAKRAIRQAIDLQTMQGREEILPVLFVKTGGIALMSFELLKLQTGLSLNGHNKVLLYCPKEKSFQVLHEVKQFSY